MSRLGETIRNGRLNAKMSEKQLGKKCGFSESFIQEIESGRRIISDEQAQRVLKVLGVTNPVSTELEVAAEPEVKLRPRPRPYVMPIELSKTEPEATPQTQAEASDAWLDALGGVVRRVPVMDENGLVMDHVLVPVIGGKIEGGAPDKVSFFRCPDDTLRGFRIYAGDLLLTVPEKLPMDDAIMLISLDGIRMARKIKKLDGAKLLLQSYDQEFAARTLPMKEVLILGRCVRLERSL